MIRYGISGCGYFGAELARQFALLPDAEVVACTSPGNSSLELAEELDLVRYASYESFLQHGGLDTVIIAGPNNTHYAQFIAAAKAGKNIFIEKPFALSYAEAKEMLELASINEIKFMVGHIMHFYPRVLETKTLLESGDLGRPINIHVERIGWEERQANLSWKKQKAISGGHLFHHIHELDLTAWFFGNVEQVYCVADNFAHQAPEFGDEDDVLLLTLKHVNTAISTLQFGSGFRFPNHFIRINCTDGGVLLDFQNNKYQRRLGAELFEDDLFSADERQSLTLYKERGGSVGYGRPGQQLPQYLHNALRREVACFHEVQISSKIPERFIDLFDGASALTSVGIAEAAMISAERKLPVDVKGEGVH